MNALDSTPPTESQTWLDVVSAVDYLSRGHRPGLTVYGALEEALRWHTAALVEPRGATTFAEASDLPWDDSDPLRSALERLVLHQPPCIDDEPTVADALHRSLMVWTHRMSDRYNDGRRWAHGRSETGAPSRMMPPLDTLD